MSNSAQIGKYVPLKTVVQYCLDETNKSQGDQDQAWILGFRALIKLNQQVSAEPKTKLLPVELNKTVLIPASSISVTKVGILNERGEVSTLKINNALTTFRDTSPNRTDRIVGEVVDGANTMVRNSLFFNYYDNGGYCNLFGAGGGLVQYGECRLDEDNGIIILPTDFNYKSVLVEYISNPERDTDFMVLTSFQEAIIAFIKWKLKLGSSQEFYAEVLEARRTLPGKKVTLQGINQVIRESQSMKLRS